MANYSDIPKAYDASQVEDDLYAEWEASGVFNPDTLPERNQKGEAYCIVMPPPNRTGTLHMGHAAMLAIEDLMIRFQRMQGKRTLWIPGTDHAAIATQVKVEQLLIKQGMQNPRQELGREKFLEKVVEFAEESAITIRNQVRKMGSSCDWSREKCTLDEDRNRAVNAMFRMMYADGVIERGYRVVNWDPQFQTTLSDDEVLTKETTARLLTFKYDADFPIAISTTRPETKFGDTAVAVHPDDARYTAFIGKTFTPTFCGKKLSIKVVADNAVDPEFGTGALGVTPAHSMIDAEMAERHTLPTVVVIGKDACMLPEAGKEFSGLTVKEARQKVEDLLSHQGLLQGVEEIPQNLPVAERGGAPVEQLPMRQWFVRVNKPFALRQDTLGKWKKGDKVTLKELMVEAVQSKQTTIVPERFDKTYFHWINNLRDWCISRQIWFGHRIPAWYKGEEIAVSETSPGEGWEQDPDTLDTWFSSGMWTFSTLGWPLTRVVFVRHGQAQSNLGDFLDDTTNNPENNLTEKGVHQAEDAAERLAHEGAVHIVASPVLRAKHTAEILAKKLDVEISFDDRLREIGVGKYNNGTEEAFQKARGSFGDWVDGETTDSIESYAQLKARAFAAMDEIVETYAGKTVIVVSHGDVLGMLGTYGSDRKWADEMGMMQNGGQMVRAYSGKGKQSTELETYHPTAVLETGYDILFFWVARMVLMSTYALGTVPFKDVYLHGLIRDEQGRKMSKSLGNILDPLDLIPKYGTDAVRLSLVMGSTPGQDVKLSEQKIEGLRNFTNKLWNISRFILTQIGSASTGDVSVQQDTANTENGMHEGVMNRAHTLADRWILSRLETVVAGVTQKMETFQFSAAADELRDFTWGDLADWYLEVAKIEKGKEAILLQILQTVLKLWHPFMPFVTEHIWKIAGFGGMLIVAEWPDLPEGAETAPLREFEMLRSVVTDMRHLRADQGVEAAKMVEFAILAPSDVHLLLEENREVVSTLTRASSIEFVTALPEGWVATASGNLTIALNLAGSIDRAKERTKIQKEIEETEKYIASLGVKMKNQEFMEKAPTQVKESMDRKYGEAHLKLMVLKERLETLG